MTLKLTDIDITESADDEGRLDDETNATNDFIGSTQSSEKGDEKNAFDEIMKKRKNKWVYKKKRRKKKKSLIFRGNNLSRRANRQNSPNDKKKHDVEGMI